MHTVLIIYVMHVGKVNSRNRNVAKAICRCRHQHQIFSWGKGGGGGEKLREAKNEQFTRCTQRYASFAILFFKFDLILRHILNYFGQTGGGNLFWGEIPPCPPVAPRHCLVKDITIAQAYVGMISIARMIV